MRVEIGATDVSVILRIVDSTDGTPETSVTSATGGLAIGYWRKGAASYVGLTESDLATLDAAHSDGGLLHIADGYYRVDFPDAAFVTGATEVLLSATATGMVGIGLVVEIGPTLTTIDTNVDSILADTGTDGVIVASIANNAVTAAAIADGAIDAATFAAGAINAAAIADAAIDAATFAAGAITATVIATDAIDADALAADAVAEIADGVWDEASTGHVDAGKAGAQLWTDVDAILADTNEIQGDWTDAGRLDAILDAIVADTNELQTDLTDGGRLDLILDATLADTAELQGDWVNGGRLDLLIDAILADTNELQGDWVNGGRLDLIIDAILGDTNELQTDWTNGGRLDLLIDAIKVITDALTAAAAAKLAISAGTIVSGAAEAGTLSTTQMTSDLAEATDDHYNGRIVIWTSGVLQNQASDITDYAGATGMLTYTAVTEAPSAADTFIIV